MPYELRMQYREQRNLVCRGDFGDVYDSARWSQGDPIMKFPSQLELSGKGRVPDIYEPINKVFFASSAARHAIELLSPGAAEFHQVDIVNTSQKRITMRDSYFLMNVTIKDRRIDWTKTPIVLSKELEALKRTAPSDAPIQKVSIAAHVHSKKIVMRPRRSDDPHIWCEGEVTVNGVTCLGHNHVYISDHLYDVVQTSLWGDLEDLKITTSQ